MNPGAVYLRYCTSVLEPATYPPHDANDLLRVPIHRSTSPRSTPKCSPTPRPVAPRTPMECASSTSSSAPYFFFSSMYLGSVQMSPSIEYTPSTAMSTRL